MVGPCLTSVDKIYQLNFNLRNSKRAERRSLNLTKYQMAFLIFSNLKYFLLFFIFENLQNAMFHI